MESTSLKTLNKVLQEAKQNIVCCEALLADDIRFSCGISVIDRLRSSRAIVKTVEREIELLQNMNCEKE